MFVDKRHNLVTYFLFLLLLFAFSLTLSTRSLVCGLSLPEQVGVGSITLKPENHLNVSATATIKIAGAEAKPGLPGPGLLKTNSTKPKVPLADRINFDTGFVSNSDLLPCSDGERMDSSGMCRPGVTF